MRLFQQLTEILKAENAKDEAENKKSEQLEYVVSAKLKDIDTGTWIITGGKITKMCEDLVDEERGNYHIAIDDEVGETSVYVIKRMFEENKEALQIGNVVLFKGRVGFNKSIKEKFLVAYYIEIPEIQK